VLHTLIWAWPLILITPTISVQKYEIWNSSLCIFLKSAVNSVTYKYLRQHHILKHLHSVFFPGVRYKISHPCTKTLKIALLNISILIFIEQ
jgi:hypothetical protein